MGSPKLEFVAPCAACYCMRCKKDISAEVDIFPVTGPDPLDEFYGFDTDTEFLLGHVCYDCEWEMNVFEDSGEDFYYGELMDQ